MTRKSLKLSYIPKESVRKATFNKRKKGITKKAHELSVLCDVDVCAIIYNPYNTEPDIWPSNPLLVRRILTKYNEIPVMDQTKRTSNLESHLKQRIGKALEQCHKQRRDNREKEMTLMMYNAMKGQTSDMNIGDIHDLICIIDQNLKDIHTKFQMLSHEGSSSNAKQLGSVTMTLVEQPLLSKLEDNGHKYRS